MVRNKFSIFVYSIIGLAFIGIISQLFQDPMAFLKSVLMTIGIGVVLFTVVYFFLFRSRKRTLTNEMKKYKQAAKQSQLKYKTNRQRKNTNKQQTPHRIRNKPNQSASHLRVIEGNKDKPKRKNRATF